MTGMTPRERVAAAFEGRPCDKIPVHHIHSSSQVASVLLGREAYVGGGIQQWREVDAWWQGEDAHAEFVERSFRDAIDLARILENDIIRPSYWRYNRKPTKRIDENTFLFEHGDESEWQVLRYDPPSEQCNLFPYRAQRPVTFEDIEREVEAGEKSAGEYRPSESWFDFEFRAQKVLGDRYAIRIYGMGISLPLADAGNEAWFEALILRPDLIARHLDLQVEHARHNIAFLAARGFKYFFGGGDFASNAGPMYSPRHFHELLAPRLRQITDICDQHGVYHLFASDGNLWPVADDVFGYAGTHGFYEIDRRAGMDLRRLHDRFPHLTTVGNISSHTLHLGTKADVIRETTEAIAEGKRHSHTVIGVSNSIVPGTPIENVMAMLDTIREQR
jgi:hypothetical protein